MNNNSTEKFAGTRKPLIMVVDDEPANLQVIRMVAGREKLECDLLLFERGEDALEALKTQKVQLILLDVVMPGLNGFEVYAQLRNNPAWDSIPVIFLSAVNEPEYISRGLGLGAVDYIGKPIVSKILAARLRSVLRVEQLKSELVARNKELENINRLKDEFLSICSHDLRSPLNAIDLICQFLTEALEGKSTHSKEVLVSRISNQAKLARRLVENLLDLSRIEEGQLVPHPVFFPVGEFLTLCLEDELPLMQAKGVVPQMALPEEDLLCFADREMMAQMVRNVIGNAIKFAETKVVVSCRMENQTPQSGGVLMIQVSDDGQGVPEEDRDYIFNKYARSDTHLQGSGLGLYISQKIAQAHGGAISLVPRPGFAASFEMKIPLAFHRKDLPDMTPVSEKRIQVLSAAKQSGYLLENTLLEAGLVHVEAVEADQAFLDPANPPDGAVAPDLVVIDLHSTAMESLPILKIFSGGPKTPLWIFYGTPEELEELSLLAPGGFSKLTNPLNPLIYLQLVKSLLAGSGQKTP
ncbi:MAG: hybrid sensor histidine kinase/response regulator [Deltaproteobacteria bacterium]|nr:hybrid sensor histidine kinase/response regulator [Deltaproteobacteria bacterium]